MMLPTRLPAAHVIAADGHVTDGRAGSSRRAIGSLRRGAAGSGKVSG